MKRIAFFLVVICVLSLVVSCSSKGTRNDKHKKEYVFTAQDTAEVKSLVDAFIERIDSSDIGGAVEMIQVLHNDSLFPLTPGLARHQGMALSVLRGVKWKMAYIIFRNELDNEVKIDITLFEKPEGDPKPNMSAFYLRPVKFEGKWYLTTLEGNVDLNKLQEDEEDEDEKKD